MKPKQQLPPDTTTTTTTRTITTTATTTNGRTHLDLFAGIQPSVGQVRRHTKRSIEDTTAGDVEQNKPYAQILRLYQHIDRDNAVVNNDHIAVDDGDLVAALKLHRHRRIQQHIAANSGRQINPNRGRGWRQSAAVVQRSAKSSKRDGEHSIKSKSIPSAHSPAGASQKAIHARAGADNT